MSLVILICVNVLLSFGCSNSCIRYSFVIILTILFYLHCFICLGSFLQFIIGFRLFMLLRFSIFVYFFGLIPKGNEDVHL
jgi:hypothetical protein